MASISEDPDHSKAKEPFSNTNTDLNGPSDLNEDDEQFGVIHRQYFDL